MSTLNEPIAKRIAQFFRTLMSSTFKDEAISARDRMLELLKKEGLDYHDIATVIENANGEIEAKKYSDTDAEIIFAKGVEKGRTEEARKQQAPPEFYDADGAPRWYEIAMFCQGNVAQLHSEWERNFVNDMPSRIIKFGKPTERMIPHLMAIFVKLGGHYDPKTAHIHS
jgi:hypothetical protein